MNSIRHINELPRIYPFALKYNVDPFFILAIREVENGGPGKEFGVLSIPAPTWDEQCSITCNSVAHKLAECSARSQVIEYVSKRACYSQAFINYFASVWAPTNAPNDPTGMNRSWPVYAMAVYQELLNG